MNTLNTLGILLRELRGNNSLRTIAEKTNNRISFTYLATLEKGINPNTSLPITPTPETLQILSDVYEYPYEKLLIAAGILKEEIDNKVEKVFEAYQSFTEEEKRKFSKMISDAYFKYK